MDLGKLARKAKAMVDKNGERIASGVDKATDFVDKKTGGKHHDKLEKVDDLAAKLDKSKEDDEAPPKEDDGTPS